MFDKALLRRLAAIPKGTPPLLVDRVRLPSASVGGIRIVAAAPDVARMEAELGQSKVTHLALAFLGGNSARVGDSPRAAGLVAVVRDAADQLLAVRYALDLRSRVVVVALGRVLDRPHRVVVHDLPSTYVLLRAAGLAWPRATFSTRLAARLLGLGTTHAAYEKASDAQSAKVAAAAKRDEQVSLLRLAQKYGVVVPASPERPETMRQLAGSQNATPINLLMAEAITDDATIAAALHLPLRSALVEAGLDWHFDHVEQPGALALAELAREGATVDRARMSRARVATERAVAFFEAQLRMHGFKSPRSFQDQLRVIGSLGLLELFRSDRGFSFDEDRLEEHRDRHAVVELLLRHSKFTKLLDQGLLNGSLVAADGRVHPRVDPLGSETGRPTFRGGNLPGIGRIMRPIVVPDGPGLGLVELDFKMQELVIAAAQFGDDVLLADCNDGDAYVRMVRELCPDQLSGDDAASDDSVLAPKYPRLRDRLKLFALITLYGGESETAVFRERFFERYPMLKAGMRLAVEGLRARGYAEGVTGLKRYRGASGRLMKWEERWAVNTVIQGGGACVLKLLLPRLQKFLALHGGRVVLAIFDAVVIQVPLRDGRVPVEIVEGAKAIMVEAMRELYPATLPRVSVNDSDPSCWNKDGHSDSIERFLADPMFRL